MFLKVIKTSIRFKISYDQNGENCDNSKNQFFTNISSLPKNTPQICHQFNLYVLLISGKKIL